MNMYCRNAKTAGKKLTTLIRISKFITFAQRKNNMKVLLSFSLTITHLLRETN